MYAYIYIHLGIYAYMYKSYEKENRWELYARELKRKKKLQNICKAFFFLVFIALHSERKLKLLEYYDFKKCLKRRLFVLVVRSFIWILPFICCMMFSPYTHFACSAKLSHLTQEITLWKSLVFVWGPVQSQIQLPRDIKFGLVFHLWWFISSHGKSAASLYSHCDT